MNSRYFRVLFLYEWKSNASATGRNINAAFRSDSVNEHTIQCWYAKFETGDASLTMEDQGRPEKTGR